MIVGWTLLNSSIFGFAFLAGLFFHHSVKNVLSVVAHSIVVDPQLKYVYLAVVPTFSTIGVLL